jgi:predicted Zn-dependent peptidase
MKIIEHHQEKRMDEQVMLAEADCGTSIAISRKQGFSTSAAYIGLRFGSNDTHFRNPEGELVEVPQGSAHFLEHKLFEGREEKVFDRFGRIGANFNGGTGFATTSYFFVSSGHFVEGLEILLDFVQTPLITEQRVEKEKGIIEQEVRMYEDEPGYRGLFLLHKALYHKHEIRITPGGPVPEVHRTTAEHLQACFDAFYRPHNLVLSLAGDFEIEPMLERVEGLLGDGRPGQCERRYAEEPAGPAAKWLEEEFPVSRPHVWLGWRDRQGPGLGPALMERWLLSSLALDLVLDHSSTYHAALYQAGVVDDSLSVHYSVEGNWGYACVEGLSDDPEQFVAELRKTVAAFVEQGPQQADFDRVRRAAWGSVVSGIQTPAALAGSIMRGMLQNQRPFAILDALEKVTLEQVAERARELFAPEQSAVAVIKPVQ